MTKSIIILTIIVSALMLAACHESNSIHDKSIENDMTTTTETSKLYEQMGKEYYKMENVEKEIDKAEYETNKQMIVNELKLEANGKKIDIIMKRYYELENGLIQELSSGKEGVDEYLYILTESGNEYRFYLSGTGVDSIYDITNNDWPVKSIM